MRPTVSVDSSGLRARVEQAIARSPRAREDATMTMVEFVGEYLQQYWPRDTNRSWNGFAQALRDVGLTRFTDEPLRESRARERIVAALTGQVATNEYLLNRVQGRIDAWYIRPGRKRDRHYHRLTREARRHTKDLERARTALEQYLGNNHAILIDDAGILIAQPGQRGQRRRVSTVRYRVYGGSGAVRDQGGVYVVELRNHEPQTRFVERKRRILAAAGGHVRTAGLRAVAAQYLRQTGLASPATGGGVAA